MPSSPEALQVEALWRDCGKPQSKCFSIEQINGMLFHAFFIPLEVHAAVKSRQLRVVRPNQLDWRTSVDLDLCFQNVRAVYLENRSV